VGVLKEAEKNHGKAVKNKTKAYTKKKQQTSHLFRTPRGLHASIPFFAPYVAL